MTSPSQAAAPSAGDPATLPRQDLVDAIKRLPPQAQPLVLGPCNNALDLVHAHLPRAEHVVAIAPVAPRYMGGLTDSLLVLTSRRLIFTAPVPQAFSWVLTTLTKFQYVPKTGPIIVEANGAEFMLGADAKVDPYGQEFERLVHALTTAAVLSQG